MVNLSKDEARKFILRYQRLYKPRQLRSDDAIVEFIKKIGCIQFDPLNKVARNADLVLQSRCSGFSEQTLYHLLYDKRELLDGWDKNMSIWATQDWPYFNRRRELHRKRYAQRADEFGPANREIVSKLAESESISSNDIDIEKKVHWSWAPTKIGRAALEAMYHSGVLAIHHKEGVRKYYGLTRNLIPESILNKPDPNSRDDDYKDWYVKRRIGGIGLLWNRSGDAWLGTNLKKEERTASIERLLEKGELAEVTISGVDDPFYMPAEEIPLLNNTSVCHEASIIAALDNLIWDRKLISRLFDFDYKWEVYTPAKQRKFGYYVLPVIYGDTFISRFEPVLDKKTNELIIKNWWWEEGVEPTQRMERALVRCFKAFCSYLCIEKISISNALSRSGLQWLDQAHTPVSTY